MANETPVRDAGLRAALAEAEASGILPLTSTCNISCLFCSNRWNPPGVRVYSVPPRSLPEIRTALLGMRRRKEIVVGESASRVNEGEPLTHPRFAEVVREVRRAAPEAPLKITTNGTLLDPDLAALLADSGPVEVTLSLNTLSPENWRRLHGVSHDPVRPVRLLSRAGIPYRASIVCVPAVTGSEDLLRTVRRLQDWGCLDCRVFVPGYTAYTAAEVTSLLPSREEVVRLVSEVRAVTDLPLTVEPPSVTDLRPELAGVVRGTPAARAGLRAGDVLSTVGGKRPFSRVDAFRLALKELSRRGRCRVEVAGRGEVTLQSWEDDARSPGGRRPGFVMERDLDPRDIDLIRGTAGRLGARRAVVLTSVLGGPPLAAGLAAGAAGGGTVGAADKNGRVSTEVHPVPSRTFGGSIACAGLLTVGDFEAVLRDTRFRARLRSGDVIMLPPVAFAWDGFDLLGRTPDELRALLPEGVRLIVPGASSRLSGPGGGA